ncbi:hypothetical protein GCM10027062_09210 [Nocardioides hungaricus]
MHYFTSPEDAKPWLEQHPDAEVVPVADASHIGAAITTGRLNRYRPDPATTSDDNRGCC